jgi:nicotinate-nucleotide adenylyltransferase
VIGILGGTFDPIHFGHLRMAQELANALEFSEVRFIPAANPPHRDAPAASAVHRAAMARLAISGNPTFRLDDCELQRFILSGAPSYTIDTLLALRKEIEDDTALCLILGSDAFMGLASWHRWDELLSLCHIVVAHRPNAEPQPERMPAALQACWRKAVTENIEDLHSKNAGYIFMQRITPLDISASNIRQDLRRGASPRYLMADEVINYIEAYQLYR